MCGCGRERKGKKCQPILILSGSTENGEIGLNRRTSLVLGRNGTFRAVTGLGKNTFVLDNTNKPAISPFFVQSPETIISLTTSCFLSHLLVCLPCTFRVRIFVATDEPSELFREQWRSRRKKVCCLMPLPVVTLQDAKLNLPLERNARFVVALDVTKRIALRPVVCQITCSVVP